MSSEGGAQPEASASDDAASTPATATTRRTLREVIAAWEPRLQRILEEWQQSLPDEAKHSWTQGAAYIRESSAGSLVGDAPDVQLRNVLTLMAQKRIYVAADALFFDVESGTDIAPRAAFQRLFERAIAGGFKAIGVFVNERLFRNVQQATAIKRQFRLKGIDLVYLGRYEGDQRNPAAWHFETMQDTAAELHARNTSFYIGTHFEVISRQGRPVGGIHEVFKEGPRAPSFLGRRGSVLHWTLLEPLASILKEGMTRYLAGASYTDLAHWSATTELKGVTPKGRVMDRAWWHNTLKNPTLAGYQKPTQYMGFKPGKESPPRLKLTAESELVPSVLPALWSLENYRTVRRLGKERSHGPKVRRSYRQYLLSGVAYDADCGHRLKIQQARDDGRFWMACPKEGVEPRHSPGRRADVAERELDDIIGSLALNDPELESKIEEELRKLSDAQNTSATHFKPDPAISAARRAVAALGRTGMNDVRLTLQGRIGELEAADRRRREAFSQPLVDYRKAMAHIREWEGVWKDSDKETKNRLLREVGLRVAIGAVVGKKGPARITAISSENPVFGLALATALKDRATTLDQDPSWYRTNAISLDLDPEWRDAARTLGLGSEQGVFVRRPAIVLPRGAHLLPPERPPGVWLTAREFADEMGISFLSVYSWIAKHGVPTITVMRGKRAWYLIAGSELDRRKAA